MPKLSNMITLLDVKGQRLRNPEWWASKHKLNKEIKKEVQQHQELLNSIKANADFSASYSVSSLEPLSVDKFVRQISTDLDRPEFSQLAPWNSAFRKSTPIIIYKK